MNRTKLEAVVQSPAAGSTVVALVDARFGVAFTISRRAPTARLRTTTSDKPRVIRIIKVLSFCNVLHFTSHFSFACFSRVKCKVYLRFTLPLPQMAAVICSKEAIN